MVWSNEAAASWTIPYTSIPPSHRELVRKKRCWPLIWSDTSNVHPSDDDNGDDDMEDEEKVDGEPLNNEDTEEMSSWKKPATRKRIQVWMPMRFQPTPSPTNTYCESKPEICQALAWPFTYNEAQIRRLLG